MKFETIRRLYDDLKAKRDEYTSLWQDISEYVGIQVDEKYFDSKQAHSGNDDRGLYVDDPTAALSVIQAGDYLDGIIWGTGEDALTLEPSDFVLENSDKSLLDDYYKWRTEQLLKNMNHPQAGFSTARKSYFYDQVAFGTSGIGSFINDAYLSGKEDHPYIFRSFGVDNTCIDEGVNGQVEIVFCVYQWRVARIVDEFGETNIPSKVLDEFKAENFNRIFTVVQGIFPRLDYNPRKKGKVSAKYQGHWFLDNEGSSGEVFFEEDFRAKPIGMCRAIKVRGEIYGRSSGTLLISSIKSVNYMFEQAMENIEKMNNPALGTFSNSIFGDSVVDTSAGGLVPFNQDMTGGQMPMFKLYDTGDPTALVSFLIPYLNEKIATGFKTDILLDFASAKDMTATESLQRYAIRGRSLSGLISQQKNEMLIPLVTRNVQLEDDMGLSGIKPTDTQAVKEYKRRDQAQRIIPDAVMAAMEAGKPWFKIRFNNELERLNKTEKLERVMQLINGIAMLANLNPQILQAVEWYKLMEDINEALGMNYIKDEDEFKAIVAQQAKVQEQAMLLQAGQGVADIQGKMSKANKDEADAKKQS